MKSAPLFLSAMLASAALPAIAQEQGLIRAAPAENPQQPGQAVMRAAPAQAGAPPLAERRAAADDPTVLSVLTRSVQGTQIDPPSMTMHVTAPPHVLGAESDDGPNEGAAGVAGVQMRAVVQTPAQGQLAVRAAPQGAMPAPNPERTGLAAAPGPYLDVEGFAADLHDALADQTAGYAMQLRHLGRTAAARQWNWAQYPDDGGLDWSADRPMHVASVSKLITAMAMARLLHEEGISLDTPIVFYLPAYWTKGGNIGDVTFRDLLTHRSGFSTGGSRSDFDMMKSKVAEGISATGSYDYENMNFGLCRILIAVINGNVDRTMDFGPEWMNDVFWDAISIQAYNDYVQTRVFAPAGVTGASLKKPAGAARAYEFPAGAGWDSGDLSTMSGGAGWHLTLDELLDVMGAFRSGDIVPMAVAQQALDDMLGIDTTTRVRTGKTYSKNGVWRRDGKWEQSVAFFLPGSMEVAVYANSPLGDEDTSLRNLVFSAIVSNIEQP